MEFRCLYFKWDTKSEISNQDKTFRYAYVGLPRYPKICVPSLREKNISVVISFIQRNFVNRGNKVPSLSIGPQLKIVFANVWQFYGILILVFDVNMKTC